MFNVANSVEHQSFPVGGAGDIEIGVAVATVEDLVAELIFKIMKALLGIVLALLSSSCAQANQECLSLHINISDCYIALVSLTGSQLFTIED